jgi:hypothetical protein
VPSSAGPTCSTTSITSAAVPSVNPRDANNTTSELHPETESQTANRAAPRRRVGLNKGMGFPCQSRGATPSISMDAVHRDGTTQALDKASELPESPPESVQVEPSHVREGKGGGVEPQGTDILDSSEGTAGEPSGTTEVSSVNEETAGRGMPSDFWFSGWEEEGLGLGDDQEEPGDSVYDKAAVKNALYTDSSDNSYTSSEDLCGGCLEEVEAEENFGYEQESVERMWGEEGKRSIDDFIQQCVREAGARENTISKGQGGGNGDEEVGPKEKHVIVEISSSDDEAGRGQAEPVHIIEDSPSEDSDATSSSSSEDDGEEGGERFCSAML